MSLPALLPNGYLSLGVHEATLSEVVERFGANTPRRQVLASRLQELVCLARAIRKLENRGVLKFCCLLAYVLTASKHPLAYRGRGGDDLGGWYNVCGCAVPPECCRECCNSDSHVAPSFSQGHHL